MSAMVLAMLETEDNNSLAHSQSLPLFSLLPGYDRKLCMNLRCVLIVLDRPREYLKERVFPVLLPGIEELLKTWSKLPVRRPHLVSHTFSRRF